MEPFQDLSHAEAWNDLVEAARRYVGQELAKSSVPRKGLEDAAIDYARTMHATFGAMWNELKKALGVMGGSTDNEHRNMVKRVCALQIERDEAVRKLAVVQADANVALEQRREADRATADEREQVEALQAALELACRRAREYKSAVEMSAQTNVDAIDRIQKLQAQVDELFEQLAHANTRAKENESQLVRQLEAENAELKHRIERATTNFANVRDALRSAESDLDYAQSKLEGNG